MAPRLRTLLLVAVVGLAASLAVPSMSGAAPAQDVTSAGLGGQVTGSTTTLLGATTAAPVAATTTTAADKVVDTPSPPAQRLVTESRKVAAVIGALLIVALALMLLTVRYWRATKPLPVEAEETVAPKAVSVADTLDDDSIFSPTAEDTAADEVAAPSEPATAEEPTADTAPAPADAPVDGVPGTDHESADDDWEPHATGEQERIEVPPVGAPARPSASARRKALGISSDS